MHIHNKVKYFVWAAAIVLLLGVFASSFLYMLNDWRHIKSSEYLYEAKKGINDSEKLFYLEKSFVLDRQESVALEAGLAAQRLGQNDLAQKYFTHVRTSEGYFQLANSYYEVGEYDSAILNYKRASAKGFGVLAYLGSGKSYLKLGDINNARQQLFLAQDIEKLPETQSLLEFIDDSVRNNPTRPVLTRSYNALTSLGYPQAAKKLLSAVAEHGGIPRDGLIQLAKEEIEEGSFTMAYNYLHSALLQDPYYPQTYQQLALVCSHMDEDTDCNQYSDFYPLITF